MGGRVCAPLTSLEYVVGEGKALSISSQNLVASGLISRDNSVHSRKNGLVVGNMDSRENIQGAVEFKRMRGA